MTLRYVVGIKLKNQTDQMTVDAEDALIAALKVKAAHPEAAITYVRKQNTRGDRRHPHGGQVDEGPDGSAAAPASTVTAARSGTLSACSAPDCTDPDMAPRGLGTRPAVRSSRTAAASGSALRRLGAARDRWAGPPPPPSA